MLAYRMEGEEEVVRHSATDFANQLQGESHRLRFRLNSFAQIFGNALGVDGDALGAVFKRRRHGLRAADDIADSGIQVPADEVAYLAAARQRAQTLQSGAVGRKVAIEANALRDSAIALNGVAAEGGAGLGVQPDKAVVIVAGRWDGAETAFEKLAVGKDLVRLHAFEVRLRGRRVLREAGSDADGHHGGVAEGVGGRVERRHLDAVFRMQGVVAADMVAMDMCAEEPVDVGWREAKVGEGRDEVGFRLQVGGVDKEVLLAAHEDDASPDRPKRDAQHESAGEDLLKDRALLEDAACRHVKVVGVRRGSVGVLADEDAGVAAHEDVVPHSGADIVVFQRLHLDALGILADKERCLAPLEDEGFVGAVVAFKDDWRSFVEAFSPVEGCESPLGIVHKALVACAAKFNDIESVHFCFAKDAASAPAMRPKTRTSVPALPPMRLRPWTPPVISPAAKRPGIGEESARRTRQRGSMTTPPREVCGAGATSIGSRVMPTPTAS